ncbi:MAG: hypothetical protein KDB03_10125 [Planctomycetales bacterium]|nr:hypothetical protein [Planctomycetales bacterium]
MTNHTAETEIASQETHRETPRAVAAKKKIDRVFLVPYPNVVFLYPTLIAALVSAIGMTIWGEESVAAGSRVPFALSIFFLGILTINLIVLTVDFPRATALTLFFIVCTVALGVVLLGTFFPDMIPWIKALFGGLHPLANASFFWIIAVALLVMLITVKIGVQFDYWEVRQNELLHHHGMLSDLRRYPTSGLQVEKEITDVFEYMLLRSGRMVLRPPGNNRDLVLENIAFIDTKEKQVTQLLSARRVEINSGD